jgi:hypothetical protein
VISRDSQVGQPSDQVTELGRGWLDHPPRSDKSRQSTLSWVNRAGVSRSKAHDRACLTHDESANHSDWSLPDCTAPDVATFASSTASTRYTRAGGHHRHRTSIRRLPTRLTSTEHSIGAKPWQSPQTPAAPPEKSSYTHSVPERSAGRGVEYGIGMRGTPGTPAVEPIVPSDMTRPDRIRTGPLHPWLLGSPCPTDTFASPAGQLSLTARPCRQRDNRGILSAVHERAI